MLCMLVLLLSGARLLAQSAPTAEFPKGFVATINLQQGVVSTLKSPPDHYQIGLNFNPQYTIIPSRLRIGVLAAGIYTQGRWTAQAGPNVALRLCDMTAGVFGSVLNLQLVAGHYWGAYKQKLAGGGLQLEIAQAFTLGITTYRDYGNDQWWMQSTLGINILGFKRKSSDPFTP